MEAKELRLGNWVYHESEEKNNPFTVEVDLQDLEFISRGDISYLPIPLTPEILGKFAERKWTMGYSEPNYLIGGFLYAESELVMQKGLHWLQNYHYFRTGEELKIDL